MQLVSQCPLSQKTFTTAAELLLSSDLIYIFVYENGGPSSLCCGRSKIWCDKYVQSKINKHLNKLVFYLETKGYLKVVAFKQYLKNLLFI